jgi:GH15 family glucan-1,4-alpha-glucosidase
VECLALQGRADEAIDAFHGMFDAANDLGLFSEEYDPAAGRMLGNFPQAFAHVGVIGAAGAIDQSYTPRQARGKKA